MVRRIALAIATWEADRFIATWLGLYTLVWGLALFGPADFSSANYRGMASVMSEGAWALLMTTLGANRIGFAVWWRWPIAQVGLSVLAAAVWMFIAVSVWVSSVGSATGPWHFVLVSLANVVLAFRLMLYPRGSGGH